MTDEKVEAILRTIRLGLHPDRAAQAHGVEPSTMRSHRKRSPAFATAVKEAEAAAEGSFLGKIIRHTEKQWTAAAWLLERRWPDRWARRNPDAVESAKVLAKAPGPPVPDAPDLVSGIAKLAELAREHCADPASIEDPTNDAGNV